MPRYCACLFSIVLLVVSMSAGAGASEPDYVGSIGQGERGETVYWANYLRRLLAQSQWSKPNASDMNYVVWDPALEATAQAWAEACTPGDDPDVLVDLQSHAGIARFDVTDPTLTIGQSFQAVRRYLDQQYVYDVMSFKWADYWLEWTFGEYQTTDACAVEDCGLGTQLMWADTRFVGCGRAECSSLGGDLYANVAVVCHWATGGNIVGEAPYQVGDACSACGPGTTSCEEGLCFVCDPEDPYGCEDLPPDPNPPPPPPPVPALMLIGNVVLVGALGLVGVRLRARR